MSMFDTFFCMDMKELNKIIGYNLKRLREQKNMTQLELANRAKVTQNKISAIENGKEVLGKELILRFCKVFNVHPYEFYIEVDTPLPITDIEKKALNVVKDAEKLGLPHVAEEFCEYIIHRLQKIKKGSNIENYSGVK